MATPPTGLYPVLSALFPCIDSSSPILFIEGSFYTFLRAYLLLVLSLLCFEVDQPFQSTKSVAGDIKFQDKFFFGLVHGAQLAVNNIPQYNQHIYKTIDPNHFLVIYDAVS